MPSVLEYIEGDHVMGNCLHVGGLDGEAYLEPELGPVQGSVLSPLLGTVSLHEALDGWFETEVKPRDNTLLASRREYHLPKPPAETRRTATRDVGGHDAVARR